VAQRLLDFARVTLGLSLNEMSPGRGQVGFKKETEDVFQSAISRAVCIGQLDHPAHLRLGCRRVRRRRQEHVHLLARPAIGEPLDQFDALRPVIGIGSQAFSQLIF